MNENINEYGRTASVHEETRLSYDVHSIAYRIDIWLLVLSNKLSPLLLRCPKQDPMMDYMAGTITWEVARARMGIFSSHKDSRWGHFYEPGFFSLKMK